MRALSDQMEPAPPQVQELRAALAVYRRAADEWRERALNAEAEVARLQKEVEREAQEANHQAHDCNDAQAEVARLRAELARIAENGDLYSTRIADAALTKGGGDGG